MKFADLAWAALLYYYKSSGDRKYVKLLRDDSFIGRLRKTPQDIPFEEFEAKVIFGFISSIGLRLPVVKGEDNILAQIVELAPCISALEGQTLHDCDFGNDELLGHIRRIYDSLHTVHGLWLTGISKIAHILNDNLFVPVNLGTSSHLGLLGEADDFIKWLRITQQSAREATEDFYNLGLPGMPEEFLSKKLGYMNYGCQKSLARFIDEYYWLTTSENLPVPPPWLPPSV